MSEVRLLLEQSSHATRAAVQTGHAGHEKSQWYSFEEMLTVTPVFSKKRLTSENSKLRKYLSESTMLRCTDTEAKQSIAAGRKYSL
mmetsp:Transcript_31959/g.89032  ORF Transcript_31959/g.89032 Transcript_31959/m.89032 type:complete len:86 (-) Transcript_31959:4-261(-)